MSELPDLLTVEETARLIRVGRTKAYAMAREWRATNGASGLPVVDFGNVLRVPRRVLEELIGVPLTRSLDSEVVAAQPVDPAAGGLRSAQDPTARAARQHR